MEFRSKDIFILTHESCPHHFALVSLPVKYKKLQNVITLIFSSNVSVEHTHGKSVDVT